MFTQILATFLIIIGVYIFKGWYLTPSKLMKTYAQNLQKRGYRVNYIPYNPFYIHFIAIIEGPKKQGDSLKILRQEYPKYDVIVTNIMNRPFLQFTHPDFIKDFYSVDKHYQYPKNARALDFITRITGAGLPFSQGKQWKRKRTALNAVFNFDFLKSQTNNIAKICDQSMIKFQKRGYQKDKIVQYNILQLTMQIFSQVILTSFLGLNSDEKIQGVSVAVFIKNLVDDATDIGLNFTSMLFGEKFMKLGLRKMDRSINRRVHLFRQWALHYIKQKIKTISSEIQNNQKKTEAADIIEALIMQKKSSTQTINSQQQIFNQFATFFFAATDTTSNFTQMMIYYIALNPDIQKKLRQQIQTYMKTDDYSYQNLKNFKYIDNIQKETTRVYGPGIFLFLREAQNDNYINQLPIKKGTFVTVMHQGNHYSEQYFKDPLVFRPQRWDSQCDNIPPFVLGGFSAGARTCIGKHLALLQNKIALIKFMKRYKQIILPKKNFKMDYKFLPCPEQFKTKLVLNQ